MLENWHRLQRLQARAKAQGMRDDEFVALAAEVNDRAMVSSTWGTIAERLDAIEAGLRKHAAEITVLKPEAHTSFCEALDTSEPTPAFLDMLNSHRFMK